jgi:HPt (histidine-containing phosphotransfer) domain-containing protein/HAMP domain-containing protein
MLLGDPDEKRDRADTWRNDIKPAIENLRHLSETWADPSDRERLDQLTLLLAELRAWQWSIEDVAQTPGNHPAQVTYLQTVEPVADLVTNGITTMLALESAKPLEDRTSLALISDLRHEFDAGKRALENLLITGDPADERRLRTHLQQTLIAMADIREQEATLTNDQQQVLEWLDTELMAYPLLVETVILERHAAPADLARYWLTTEAQPRADSAATLLESMSADQSALVQRQATRVSSLHNVVVAVSLLLIVAAICTVWIVSKQTADRLTRPIAALATATDELADGQLSRDLPVTTSDELGALTRSFNTMRAALDTTTDESPFAPDRENYLGRPRRLATTPQTSTSLDTTLPQQAPSARSDASHRGALDWQCALESVDGDTEQLKQAVTSYIDVCPELREQLRTAIAQGDAAKVRHAAQTIRGGLDCFGMPRAAALAYRLEEAGRRGWLESAAEQCVVLEEELDAIEPELQAFLTS